jgi:hypothetical protein
MEMFVIPIVLSLGVCHGHLDLDNRGVRFEDYDREVKNILKIFGFSEDIASMGLCVFTHHHTLRIEAEKICHTRFSVAPAGLALIGKEETPFPFDRSMLRSLTIHFNGETLSESNTPTFINLANAIDNVGICFPSTSNGTSTRSRNVSRPCTPSSTSKEESKPARISSPTSAVHTRAARTSSSY